MADVRRRLESLGFGPISDPPDVFSRATKASIEAFQRLRGLRVDGVVGPQTWNTLVEAGYRLGDRVLYHRRPPLRGDDVADLQSRLSALGFDTGRVDGIFGPTTAGALTAFQADAALPADGVLGEASFSELRRVQARSTDLPLISTVRAREDFNSAPPTLHGRRVVVGEVGGLTSVVRALTRQLAPLGAIVTTLHDPDEHAQARAANDAGADVYIALRLTPEVEGCSCAFYSGYRDVSVGGRHLAESIDARAPAALGVVRLGTKGMSLAILRETAMPAVLVEVGPVSAVVERAGAFARALVEALEDWTVRPLE